MAKKPSQPWRLVLSTAGGPVYTKHRSKPAAYRAVEDEKERVTAGMSRVVRIAVEQWDVDGQFWQRYENVWQKESDAERASAAVSGGLDGMFTRLGPPPANDKENEHGV